MATPVRTASGYRLYDRTATIVLSTYGAEVPLPEGDKLYPTLPGRQLEKAPHGVANRKKPGGVYLIIAKLG